MTEEPASYPEEWSTGARPDLDGLAKYMVLIRADGDPDENSYKKVGKDGRNKYEKGTGDSLAWTQIKKMPVEDCKQEILLYFDEDLTDEQREAGVTFNRICVELWRRTADVLHESNQEEALWQLVEEAELEHTMEAPIRFRLWTPECVCSEYDNPGHIIGCDDPDCDGCSRFCPVHADRQECPRCGGSPESPAPEGRCNVCGDGRGVDAATLAQFDTIVVDSLPHHVESLDTDMAMRYGSTGRAPGQPNLPERTEPTGEPLPELTDIDYAEVELRAVAAHLPKEEWRDLTMTMFAKVVDEHVHVTFDPNRLPRVMGEDDNGPSSDALVAVDATVVAASADHVELEVDMLYLVEEVLPVDPLQLIVQAAVCTSMQLLDDGDDDDGDGEELPEEEEEEAPPAQSRAARASGGRRRHLRAVAI